VKDQATKASFSDEESERILKNFISRELLKEGLYCRADDRGEPVVQLSPPLITTVAQFEEVEAILRKVLTQAATML
jgi:adenosylmethionine-8-amino-7-oxononanoate aminotransferase